MSDTSKVVPPIEELLVGAPSNWGKWGPDDEVGGLNYLTPETILQAMSLVRQGKVFTLQVQMGRPKGDPIWPGRTDSKRTNVIDKGHWLAEKAPISPGGLEYADDIMTLSLQGSTQYDGLGHVWYGDQLWNGYDAKTTIGSMSKASVLPIAEKGVVGAAVLIDMARHRGKDALDPGETFTHTDLLECAAQQGVTIKEHSILIVRTGWIAKFYRVKRQDFYKGWNEPGLTYSLELAEWFRDMEIPNLVTDTIANEVTTDPVSGIAMPLHGALMRNLGVLMTEIAWLEDLADDCASDGVYEFLYVAAPLKVVGGTGAPVNPIAIK
jgi:kynurenine formamidase